MTATVRKHIKRSFAPVIQTKFDNLIVSGCSYTFNNSIEHIVTWPYYLKDLANFNMVLDLSQQSSGTAHIFNSVVNEVESGTVKCNDLLIVMWTELSRADVMIDSDTWFFNFSPYQFDKQYVSKRLNSSNFGHSGPYAELCKSYHRLVPVGAQIYDSCLKINALDGYLKYKKINYVFVSAWDLFQDLEKFSNQDLINTTKEKFPLIQSLDEFTGNNREVNDGHPSVDAHLNWTKQVLIPYLQSADKI